MQNIYLIPTNKPTKIYKQFDVLYTDNELPRSQFTLEERKIVPQHIYITSNEEIKEGDRATDGKNIVIWHNDYIGKTYKKNYSNNKSRPNQK